MCWIFSFFFFYKWSTSGPALWDLVYLDGGDGQLSRCKHVYSHLSDMMYTFSSPSYTTMLRDGLGCFCQYPSGQIFNLVNKCTCQCHFVWSIQSASLLGYHGAHTLMFIGSWLWKSSQACIGESNLLESHTKGPLPPTDVGIQDENLFLQFAVSTLVPFWQPQEYSPNTERHTFPLRELNPIKATWVLGQPCVALGGMWG